MYKRQALHRAVWLGLVPATLAVLVGAAMRRWLPRHLFVYILGRGFFATAMAVAGAGALAALLYGVPENLSLDDVLLARGLAAVALPALVFWPSATPARLDARFAPLPPTLDGRAWLRQGPLVVEANGVPPLDVTAFSSACSSFSVAVA